MKKTIIICSLLALSFQTFARGGQKAIYGSFDNEFISNNAPDRFKFLATGVSFIIPKKNIKKQDKNYSVLLAKPLRQAANLCRNERFADNLVSGPGCSGFLVGKNLVATAGHCMQKKSDCRNLNMVFGVTNAKEISNGFQIANHNIYSCKKIIKSVKDGDLDYALIELDREVKARHIFELGDDTDLRDGDSVYMIGHPLGLGVTYTEPGPVTSTYSDAIFRAQIDSFGGNSGSPVIDSRTDKVVGILKGGQDDFIKENNRCTRYARYNSGSEAVARINLIKDILP